MFYKKTVLLNETQSSVYKFYYWVGRALAPSVEGLRFESPVGSSQRLKNVHLLLPWLAFTIKGLQ